MTEGGFFECKGRSPTGLALVITLHAAALGALALIKGPEIQRRLFPPTEIVFIPIPEDPPPVAQPEPERDRPVTLTQQRPLIVSPIDTPPIDSRPTDPPPLPPIRQADLPPSPPVRVGPPPAPVRVAAQFDPRYAGELQPPYPASELRADRGGNVQVRVTIGADGRVKTIERVSATSDAFWTATQRHALARWRFRPATLDGRPVESSKTMNVVFRVQA